MSLSQFCSTSTVGLSTTASENKIAPSASRKAINEEGGATIDHIENADSHRNCVQDAPPVPHNWWWRYREIIREPAAEFTGVMLLVMFGIGGACQSVLSSNPAIALSPKGDYLSLNFGWAIGAAVGVWASAGISGGHINPAVTLSFAVWRGFPWKKVPVYICAQLLGGIVGAAIVYANYFHAIDIFEGGRGVRTLSTASLFSSYTLDYMTNVSAFFSEFLATALLLIVLLAAIDANNAPPPAGLLPLVIFIVVLGIGACFGMQTGFSINPARDLGPRLLTSMVGYGREVYTYRSQYWLWCPIIAPIIGAQVGTIFYDVFLYRGPESRINHSTVHKDSAAQRQLAGGPGGQDQRSAV